MANAEESQIINHLHRLGEVSIEQLSELLGVSTSTIRRSLVALSDHRLIERTRGGARISSVVRYNPLAIYKLPIDPEEARAVSNRAVQFIQRGDVIGISGGQLCTQLALRLRLVEGITVVTNAVNVAAELVALPNIQVMLTGGRLNQQSFELIGKAVGLGLDGVHIHRFFLGTDGLSADHGVTAHDEAEAVAARTLMEHSDATMVLADSAKFKQASFAQVAPISAIETIVTTNLVPTTVRDQFEKAGVRMIVADCADSHQG